MRFDDMDGKSRDYRRLAARMLEYVDSCAEKGIAPLRYDANVFRAQLHKIDAKRRG